MFGELKSLQAVTRAKFGQPGVDAITNYPFLVNAQIDHNLYLKEEGTARPATSFSIHKVSDDSVIKTGVSGREIITGAGEVGLVGGVIFNPFPSKAGSNLPLILGAVAVVGIIAFLAFR